MGLRQTGIVVTEQGVELGTLDFQVKLVLARCVIALLRAVAIQRVVLVRIYGAEQALAAVIGLVAVEGHGQQPFAQHTALGIQADLTICVAAVFDTAFQRLVVVLEGVVTGAALGESHHHPVACARLEPGAQLLAAHAVT